MSFNIKDFVQNPDGSYSKRKTIEQPREKKGKKAHIEVQKEIYIAQQPVQENCLTFEWADKHVSLNEWYSSKHWTHRKRIAEEWHKFYKSFLIEPYPNYKQYRINLEYNSRLDPSNTIPMIKLLEDALQELKIIDDDTKDYCKGIIIEPNLSLKKNAYKLKVICMQ